MWRIYLLLAVVTLIAGLTPIGARMATSELPPMTIAFARFGLAGVLLLITARLLGLRWSLRRQDLPLFLLLAALCVPANQIGFLLGVKLANASHAGIAYALVPVLVYWISLAMRRRGLSGRMATASALAFVGAAVVILTTGHAGETGEGWGLIVGDALLLSAAATWALFIVLSQPIVRRLGAIQTLTTVFLLGTVLQIPLVVLDYFALDLATFDPSDVTWRGVVGFLFITLITAYTNYLLWYFVIARHDITRSSIVTNAAFLVTVVSDAAFFGLELSAWIPVGSAILFAGIVLATYIPKRAVATTGEASEEEPRG